MWGKNFLIHLDIIDQGGPYHFQKGEGASRFGVSSIKNK